MFSVSLVTIRCKRPQNIFQLGRNHQSCTRSLTTDHPLRSSTDHAQNFKDLWNLENMILIVILIEISLARHEVYKEMELVLKKASRGGQQVRGYLIWCSILWFFHFRTVIECKHLMASLVLFSIQWTRSGNGILLVKLEKISFAPMSLIVKVRLTA